MHEDLRPAMHYDFNTIQSKPEWHSVERIPPGPFASLMNASDRRRCAI